MNFMKRLTHDEKGLATVEAAIALPVLLLVLFGIMEGGLFVLTKHQMDRSTREGARYCALYSTNSANCTTGNVNAVIGPMLPSASYFSRTSDESKYPTLTITANSPTAGAKTVKVSVTGTFTPFTSFLSKTGMPLSASTSVVADW